MPPGDGSEVMCIRSPEERSNGIEDFLLGQGT
jgi:hypothetical protein